MQFKKGKILFSYKDTWGLNTELSEVILSGLLKFKEVINEDDSRKGVPSSISCHLESIGEITYEDGFSLSEEDWEKCYKYFDYVLDEMIFSFSDNPPDIMAYNFKHTFVKDEVQDEVGVGVSGSFECSNQAESDRYTRDVEEYNSRCEEGRRLFATHYNSLWW